MSTSKQDEEFKRAMDSEIEVTASLSGSALDVAVDFIVATFDPEDVFSIKSLGQWAENNGYEKK